MVLTLSLFGCDYASKFAAKATLEGGGPVPVAPAVLHGAVELRYVENDDIAFNTLRTLGVPRSPALLLGLSALAVVSLAAMAIAARRQKATPGADKAAGRLPERADRAGETDHMTHAGLALTASGALGNIVDRISRGYVVDFIHVKGWPVFNVADIAVVLGMGMLLLGQLRKRRRAGVAPDPPV
jgi:lipoprotein signal peptidase